MTDYHNYATPSEGAKDWHVPLNENFDKIDTDIEIRDLQSNRSNYTPQQGAKYFATDTGRVWVGDGNQQWRPVHTGNVVDVTAYDGSDLGEQWNTAIDEQETISNRIWVVPPREEPYRLETPVDMTDNRTGSFNELLEIRTRGAVINVQTEGTAAVDLTGTGRVTLELGEWYGDDDYLPKMAFLFGDNGTTQAEGRYLRTGKIHGGWELTPVYVQGREDVEIGVPLINDHNSGYALVVSPNNVFDISSDFTSLASRSSVSSLRVYGNRLFSREAPGDGVVYLEGAIESTVFSDVEIAPYDESEAFYLDLSQQPMRHLTFRAIEGRQYPVSGQSNSKAFVVDDDNAGNNLEYISFEDFRFNTRSTSDVPKKQFFEVKGNVHVNRFHIYGRHSINSTEPVYKFANNLYNSEIQCDGTIRINGSVSGSLIESTETAANAIDLGGGASDVLIWSHADGHIRYYGSVEMTEQLQLGSEDLTSVASTDVTDYRHHNGANDQPEGLYRGNGSGG